VGRSRIEDPTLTAVDPTSDDAIVTLLIAICMHRYRRPTNKITLILEREYSTNAAV
jgi:hypothetical protein